MVPSKAPLRDAAIPAGQLQGAMGGCCTQPWGCRDGRAMYHELPRAQGSGFPLSLTLLSLHWMEIPQEAAAHSASHSQLNVPG